MTHVSHDATEDAKELADKMIDFLAILGDRYNSKCICSSLFFVLTSVANVKFGPKKTLSFLKEGVKAQEITMKED